MLGVSLSMALLFSTLQFLDASRTMVDSFFLRGQKQDLKPPEGHDLPPAPYGAATRPTAAELLEPRVQAAPERSVELRKRSEEREDDPFDLPPEN